EQERHGIYPTARLVDEVQLDAVQRHGELPQAVDARFVRAPVEALLPMSHELSQMGEASPGRPGRERRLVRKARARQTLAQIGERGFGNVEFEWLDAQLCREGSRRVLTRRQCRASIASRVPTALQFI